MPTIDISITPGGIPPTVNVSQYDEGRPIDVNIDLGDVEISTSITYFLEVRKSDTHTTQANGTVQSNGAVRFVTTRQMTYAPGLAVCKVRVKYGSSDIGTAKFYLNVEETPINEDAAMSDLINYSLIAQVEAGLTAEQVSTLIGLLD